MWSTKRVPREHKSPFNHNFFASHMMGLCVLLCRSMLLFCCCTFISHFLPLLLMIFRLSQSPCVSRSNKCTFSVEINTFYRRHPPDSNDNANDWRKIPFRKIIRGLFGRNFFSGRSRGEGWNAFTLRFHSTLHAPSIGLAILNALWVF